MKLDEEDIDELSKAKSTNSSARVPISTKYKKELTSFRKMIREKKDNKEPGAKDISSYDPDEINEYYEDFSKKLRNTALAHMGPSTPGPPPTGTRPVKSKWEKALDNWNRGKHDKNQFPVLQDNAEFITWNEKFIAECNVQELSNIINPEYILDKTDPFEEVLFTKQCTYLWSVLLTSLNNSYGTDCMSERMEDNDARLAYFQHQKKHTRSVTQAYGVSKLGNDLRALNLDNYHGNRTKFLVEWFEILRKMDKMGDRDDKYPYAHVRMQLMEAVKSDSKLTDAFTTLAQVEDKNQRESS